MGKRSVAGAFGKGGVPPKQPNHEAPPKPQQSAPASPASRAGIPQLPPPATSSSPAETRAGVQTYNTFFALYAQSLAGNTEFWPLGFIPGPAILTYGDEVVSATPDVARQIDHLPVKLTSLPQRVRQSMEEWAKFANGLGYQPSSWNAGQAKRLLSGRKPDGKLVVGMPRFRYRSGDGEVPFGVVLEPTEASMTVSRIYNPANIADVPTEGSVLSFAVLKDGRGPVQKILRTWALMEANFSSRFNRDGSPRQDSDRRD